MMIVSAVYMTRAEAKIILLWLKETVMGRKGSNKSLKTVWEQILKIERKEKEEVEKLDEFGTLYPGWKLEQIFVDFPY